MKKSNLFLTLPALIMAFLMMGFGSAKAVSIVSIVPENETSIDVTTEGSAVATITFSSPAKVTRANWPYFPRGPVYYCEYNNAEGNAEYGTKWNIIFPESYVTAMLRDNNDFVRAEVTYTGQDNTNGTVILDFTINANPGAEFNVITQSSALGYLNYFNVENPEGYVAANNHVFVLEGGISINPFEEITITGPNGFVAHPTSFDKANNQTVYFSPEITESGEYSIHFPYRAFNLGQAAQAPEEGEAPPEGDIAYYSIEKDYTFRVTISNATFLPEATLLNPKTHYVSNVGSFQVCYKNETVEIVNRGKVHEDGYPYSATPAKLTIEGVGTYNVYPYLITTELGNPGIGFSEDAEVSPLALTEQTLMFDFFDVISQFETRPTGTYSLNIPANMVKNSEGAINPNQSFEVIYLHSADEVEITPPSYDFEDPNWPMYDYDASELADVIVFWPQGTLGRGDETAKITATSKTSNDMVLEYGKEVNIVTTEDDSSLRINLSALAPGYWTVIIPTGYVVVGGEYINDEIFIDYHIVNGNTNGVTTIPTDAAGSYKVYDLNGVNVLNTASEADVKALPAGLYIINGAKVIIRK